MIGGGMSHGGMFRRKISSFCPYLPGLYTEEEVDDLINIDGYIPVASADEYRLITSGMNEEMGGCSQWNGTYTTGLDKKYIQIFDIDFQQINIGLLGGLESTFVYDGNELKQDNMPDSMFGTSTTHSVDAQIKNLRINTDFGVITVGVGGYAITRSNRSLVTNVIANVRCKKTGGNRFGGFYESQVDVGRTRNSKVIVDFYECEVSVGAFCSALGGEWTQCESEGSINTTANETGGFASSVTANAQFLRCKTNCDATTLGLWAGGFIGRSTSTLITITVDECFSLGKAKAGNIPSGFWAENRSNLTIRNCYTRSEVDGPLNASGFIDQDYVNTIIERSFSASQALGATSGGFNKRNEGIVTECYFDLDSWGSASTGQGNSRTTPQMQEGSENSYILPEGGIDGGSSPSNLMYQNWDSAIWEFLPTNSYPTLKNNPE